MKSSRSDLIRRILLTIDKQPSSIYDILYSLSNFSDPKRTRLPKLLKSMENENLVKSALQPGPLGPYRRIYEPGPEAEQYLIQNLQSSMETILHFYDAYRQSDNGYDEVDEEDLEIPTKNGNILFAAYPQADVLDLDEIRTLSCNREIELSIIGPDDIFSKTGIIYNVVGEDITQIEAAANTFSEIHLRGIPPIESLTHAIAECKRVLSRGGVLRIKVPFVFFNEVEKSTLEGFIRDTIINKFPELGLVDGNEIVRVIGENFSKHSKIETKRGFVYFWAIKS